MDIEEREGRQAEFREFCKYWSREFWKVKINFNPIVTIASFVTTFSVVIWILCDDKSEEYAIDAQKWITRNFTWLYVASTMAWVVFLVVVYFSFGDVKLGRADEKPDHEDFAYFCMLFTCGLSSPIFYAGVSDTLTHFHDEKASTDFYSKETTAEKAQHAMSVTVFLWGLHGFAGYAVFGLIIGILTHRKGLPLTLRTCFYPLLGRYIFGRIGDFIDTICITSIVYGVSVSLVIGAKFLNSGFHIWNSDIDINETNQLLIVWGLTILSTISVISGIDIGIKNLSQASVVLGFLVCLTLLTAHHTAHILNVIVQTVGYYTQYLVGFGLYTAAFQQRGLANVDVDKNWMDSNTMFYWGWWISWSPFVGLFIAKISRGRTVKEIIWYSFILPVLTAMAWLVIFGTIALDVEMKAMNENITCNATNFRSEKRLSCATSSYRQTFDMYTHFEDISKLLQSLTVLGSILFFVTSSDSASLIVDCVASNGEEDPPVIQRAIWALCEGAVASAVLQHNQNADFPGLKAIAVVSGFPLTFLLCLCCYSLWRVLKCEPDWRFELYRVWESPRIENVSRKLLKEWATAIFAPWFLLGKISATLSGRNKLKRFQGYFLPCLFFNLWIVLLFFDIGYKNVSKVGLSLFIIFLCYGANIRMKIRSKYGLEGHIIADIIMMIPYPFTVLQMFEQLKKPYNGTTDQKTFSTHLEGVNPTGKENNNDIKTSSDKSKGISIFYANENTGDTHF